MRPGDGRHNIRRDTSSPPDRPAVGGEVGRGQAARLPTGSGGRSSHGESPDHLVRRHARRGTGYRDLPVRTRERRLDPTSDVVLQLRDSKVDGLDIAAGELPDGSPANRKPQPVEEIPPNDPAVLDWFRQIDATPNKEAAQRVAAEIAKWASLAAPGFVAQVKARYKKHLETLAQV